MLYDPASSETDTKLDYETTGDVPLYFQNEFYVVSSGDMATPDVGTNYFVYGLSDAEYIQATVYDPSNGTTVMTYTNYYPYGGTVTVPWNFTEADGVTPYSNDTYVVTFTVSDPGGMSSTNTIDRTRVRPAAGSILQYEQENPFFTSVQFVDSEESTYIGGIGQFYSALYYTDFLSLTQYYPYQIGTGRDNPSYPAMPFVLNPSSQANWPIFLQNVSTNLQYSDFGYGPGHGSAFWIGGGPHRFNIYNYVTAKIAAAQVNGWLTAGGKANGTNNWRPRKSVMWACYTANGSISGQYMNWPQALGIRPTAQQTASAMYKNVGLFFNNELSFGGYGATGSADICQVAQTLEIRWVCGPSPYPGGCDPTYSFGWATRSLFRSYPQLVSAAGAVVLGYP